MTSNPDPNEGSRKTLDEIRREIDAEFAFVDPAPDPRDTVDDGRGDQKTTSDDRGLKADQRSGRATEDVREAPPDRRRPAGLFEQRPQPRPPARTRDTWDEPRRTPPRAEIRMSEAWDRDLDDDRLGQIEPQRFALGRRALDDERPRRSGYILAALVGCIVGQALLLGFFLVMQHRLSVDLLRTSAVVPPRVETPSPVSPAPKQEPTQLKEETAPAKAEPPQSKAEPPAKEETAQSIVTAPADATPPAATPARAAEPPVSPPPTDLPPRPAAASAPPRTAIVSATTTPPASRPRMTEEPRASSARRTPVASATEMADAQTRLRSALNEWLRSAARGGATTEPVIVLGADGRTAKTYVSVTSPVGMVPREQRWELGARGWNLLEDRQTGLPRAGTANSSR